MESRVASAETFTIWKKLFYLLDENSNGHIDRNEFTDVFLNHAEDMVKTSDGRKLLQLLFGGDGNQGSAPENIGAPTQEQIAALFSAMDTNLDNEIEWKDVVIAMSVDATVRHVFGYDGSAGDAPPLQLADESTLVYVSGHTLHFTSTITRNQHFFMRPQPRKIVSFDFNWKTSTFAIVAREPEASISLYSFPDKKSKSKLELPNGGQHDIFEFSLIKFSRCGRRLLSIRPAPPAVDASGTQDNKSIEARDPLLCVWDIETLAPVPGCQSSSVRGPVRFASFDPTNNDMFVVGGDNGLQIWKMYTGKNAVSSLLRAETVTLPAPSSTDDNVGQPTDAADLVEWEEKRKQFCCHSWLPRSRFLVANQAGDLLVVDAADAKVSQLVRAAARPDRCPIAGIVVTAETVVVAYSDGALAWLQIDTLELLNTGVLPGGLTGSIVTVMAPTPTYSKAYVGTRNGKIFEVRTNILQDDDEEGDNDDDDGSTRRQVASRSSSPGDESKLVVPCARFPTGPMLDSAVFTPFGGAYSTDALIATGGLRGQLAFWNLRDCRPVDEVNVGVLFTQDPTAIGAPTGSNSRPGTAGVPLNDLGAGAAIPAPPVVITALAAKLSDPVVMIGDHQGRLRSICVAKIVGGGGKVEILPQHSVQLLPAETPLDLLSIHPTQAVLMVSSTHNNVVFLLSMDHEKQFPVQAYFTLREPNERVVDIQWNATGASASSSLTLTCFSSRGLFYSARYQAPPQEDVSVGSAASGRRDVSPRGALQIVPKVIAFGEAVLPMCARLRFLTGPSSNMMIATSPGRPELTLLKFRDVLRESMEEISILSKTLTKRAHARGVSAVAMFPRVLDGGVELLVTGGMDGTVTLWTLAAASAVNARRQTKAPAEGENESKDPEAAPAPGSGGDLDEMQATKKRTLVTHSGPVTTLRFVCAKTMASSESGGPANIQLISTGIDGCVFLMDVRLSPELLGESIGLSSVQSSDPTMNPLYMNIVSCAKYDDVFQPEREQECTPFLEARTRAEAMAARDRFDRGKDATRAKLRDLEGRLKIMLAENERLPENEQLAREEFVLNVAWRDNLLNQHAARAQRVREGIARDLARMAIVRERMKREFWDVSEVPGVRLTALSPPSSASATAAPLGVPGGQQQPPQLQQSASTTSTSGQATPLFVNNFPMRRQTPREQKLAKHIAMLRLVEFAHHQQEDREGQTSDSRTRFQDTVPSDLQWILNAGSLHPKFQQGSPAVDSGASPDISEYAKMPSFDFVYHPAVVRTGKQARVQMHLLASYARALQSAFNTEFQELVRHKENTIEQIEAKNARIMEITAELNAGNNIADLFRPQWAPEEKADSLLKVSPDEMTQKPYETAERRKQREREAYEAAEREKARKKDDVGGRALIDMMDGTLEVKKDPLAAQELVKEAWMLTIPPEEMTAEQKKLVSQFEAAQAKFEEEREKYRKSLDLELRKTRGEVTDLCRAFDEKLRALRDRYMATRRAVLAQELYELRLAEELLAREQLELETKRLEAEALTMQENEARAQAESDRLAAQLEACREDWHRATEEDKVLEKSFVRELEEMVHSSGSAGGGLGSTPTASTSQLESPEFIKQLVELYRKRKSDDLVPARDGASGLEAMKRSGSNGVTAARPKGNAKQRLLAESSAMDGSSRSLGTGLLDKQASSKNNVVEPEVNLDPFQHLDSQHQYHSKRGSLTGAGSGSQRFVVTPLDYIVDRPEGVLVEDRIWRALNALRSKKILAEHAVREKAELLALAKTVSDELRTKLSDLQRRRRKQQREREALAQRRTALVESAPLLARIKQGQDETPVGGGGDNALLVARTSVEALNDVIQLHGKDQVGILGRIKDFRKNINVMEWEHALLELQARDMDERYTDIQLLRVTKDLQELFHTGDTSHKQKREAAMLEAKLAHLGRHHQTTLLKLERTGSQLERQLRERERENRNFQQQVAQLETQVQIREDILASRTSAAMRQQAAGGGVRGDAARLKAIAVRRKLVDLAKAQTDEIEYLRLELDKMRRRTFPSFAQAHARDYHDVD
ncbi:WD40/YVTN repeat-like-containing domain [Phytophthora cinnamomi]|uniref:WD40/YVTN repeat-like-containing domain n=1 Tax=Phytophthora cinnamomi TaxID=4785 RepID=UPI003559382B|nr:WD40/YVTN repeat-like-containing domain [Phytophthora cinnamomi]